MLDASQRRIVYILSLATLILAFIALVYTLPRPDLRTIAVALLLAGLSIATSFAAWRSGQATEEVDDDWWPSASNY